MSKQAQTWHGKVYRQPTEQTFNFEQFYHLAKVVFKRDGQQCQACFRTVKWLKPHNRYLTAHHILPRNEGGEENLENLLTLCNICHDKIEELHYRSKQEIYGCQTTNYRHYHVNQAEGTDWHKWVYGGYRRPI